MQHPPHSSGETPRPVTFFACLTTSDACVTLVSTVGRVFPQTGGYRAAVAPFGSRPKFEHPFAINFDGFEAAPEFPAGAAVTGPNR